MAVPAPALQERRAWAKTGIVLAVIMLIAVHATLLLFWGRIEVLFDAVKKLQIGK